MSRAISLRGRLTLIIMLPLLLLSVILGIWQFREARKTADEVFDNSLLSAAIAVAHDVAISEGDALSERTRNILTSTSGGQVFYHVYAPDGVIVAGYATPPVGIPRAQEERAEPVYFTATYQGRDVSGVRLQNRAQIEGFSGIFTTTVWQDSKVRAAFVRDLVVRSVSVSTAFLIALALIVWFGVRIGLRPLLDLEEAIGQRSSDDLSAIKREVPDEVAGIVGRLNGLFSQVSGAMTAQSDFIANAAHQLRNPIAGVLALAEAVVSAKTPEQSQTRATDLVDAAQKAADLSHKLLVLERAQSISHSLAFEPVDLVAVLRSCTEDETRFVRRGIALTTDLPDGPALVEGDPVMLREAIVNLLDNALAHGGADLSRLQITLTQQSSRIELVFTDDGRGIDPENLERVKERFVQLQDTGTTGLGLSIVLAIVEGHGGQFQMTTNSPEPGLRTVLQFPFAHPQARN